MITIHHVHPRWVLVNGELRNVSDFAYLPPQYRPEAFCPVCSKPIILKLGDERAHHYAHQSDHLCITTHPETALHFNTKIYIYQQLLETRTLFVEQFCARCSRTKSTVTWLEDWDEVQVEYTVDSFRPDVALLARGKVVGAIEVCVFHPVDDQKAEFFERQGIPWLEIRVMTESLYEGPTAWKPDQPLPFQRIQPPLEQWKCNECQDKERLQQELEARRREKLEYEQQNYVFIHSARMADFYHKSGNKHREAYYLKIKVQDGKWVKAWVRTEKDVLAFEDAPITDHSIVKLREVIDSRVTKFRSRGSLADEFMEWRIWRKGTGFVPRDTRRFPFRYTWRPKLGQWKVYWE